jgi:hypothetical protein
MYKNDILVFSSFLSFADSFQLIMSPKYMKIFFMMSYMVLYYNHCELEPFGHKLGTNMNTNALRTALLELVYSTFLLFVCSFHGIKSPKCTKLF